MKILIMKDKEKYLDDFCREVTGKFTGEINTDDAWNRLYRKIKESGTVDKIIPISPFFNTGERRKMFLRIAAAFLLLAGIGASVLYFTITPGSRDLITVTTADDQRNYEVSLPDGSRVWLNRNSRLSYSSDPANTKRNVKLRGEAFFEITPDPSNPFSIDAGKATVKVLGTSFNVITENSVNEVEVFVQTGRVMLSGSQLEEPVIIEPGFIGTAGSGTVTRITNENRNYLSWKTDTLVYDGQTLDIVFSDLKKVFNINISVDDPSISNMSLSTTFVSLPHDTIIQLICNTFTLNYRKEGTVYHLSK